MSEAALQQLIHAQAALSEALVANDVDALHDANGQLVAAVNALRGVDAWHDRVGLRDALVHALKTAEAARGLVNQLADKNRRQLDRLVSLAGQPRALAYGRAGLLR
ncbi:hypothetical protein [uncultured Sphingomonas sp.]|uniref:hypothetical protein n=1 Tax=uncultured Sphingomonas sp. TaxID=158754 RepID=UPI0025EA82E0|nr:hypothetical protein [uncultured Sphingomonas sp.]